jgi:hypothetical protein
MSRRVTVGIAFFALGLVPVLLSADPINPVGFPKKGDGGGDGVFRIWYEGDSWHLRTSTENTAGKKDNLLVFTGTVRSDTKMTIEGKKLEKGKGKTSDSFTPHADGKGFDFQFKTYGATDQVDFKVTDKAKNLTFKLFLNGEKASTLRIAIGANSEHPEKSEFTLPAQPKKEK